MVRKEKTFNVLTNDPSMTAWGWAVMDLSGNVIKTGCIRTSPETKARRIRAGDDKVRRVNEINVQLLQIIRNNDVCMILSELPHGSQSASAAVMIGIVTGIVQTVSDVLNIPVEWYSEADAKNRLLGKRSAAKQDIIQAISKLYRVPWKNIKYHDEAVADAIAIYNVAKDQSCIFKINL